MKETEVGVIGERGEHQEACECPGVGSNVGAGFGRCVGPCVGVGVGTIVGFGVGGYVGALVLISAFSAKASVSCIVREQKMPIRALDSADSVEFSDPLTLRDPINAIRSPNDRSG